MPSHYGKTREERRRELVNLGMSPQIIEIQLGIEGYPPDTQTEAGALRSPVAQPQPGESFTGPRDRGVSPSPAPTPSDLFAEFFPATAGRTPGISSPPLVLPEPERLPPPGVGSLTPPGTGLTPEGLVESQTPPQTADDLPGFLSGQDPFTGQVHDIPGLIQELSRTSGGRRDLFNDNLYSSPAYASSPSSVQSFLRGRFDPLETQYAAQGIVNPGQAPNFNTFLAGNPSALGGQGWRDLFGNIFSRFGGVGSAEDVSGLGGSQQLGYDTLRTQGADILNQAIGANVHPALANSASNVLGQRFANWSQALAGAPSNQWEFVRQQAPLWQAILGS